METIIKFVADTCVSDYPSDFEITPQMFLKQIIRGCIIPELEIQSGEHVAFIGASGSGKTTLLRLLAGIVTPQSGMVNAGDIGVNRMSDAERRSFRISQIGFVFQDFRLINYLNIRENMLLPYRLNTTLKLNANVKNRLVKLAEIPVKSTLN